MQKYVHYLLTDIRAATDDLPVPWIEKETYEIADWLPREEDEKQAPKRTIEEWTGIRQEALPPDDRLTEEQIAVLMEALKALLNELNAYFCMTFINVPLRLQYRAMRMQWQQEHVWLQWHDGFFKLCEEDQAHGTCGLGWDHCQCRHFAELSKDWDDSPWTEADEERWQREMEERERRRRRDDW
ncbi:MAG: hypothetical protein AAF849_22150 [Bacteroidota bacterium]